MPRDYPEQPAEFVDGLCTDGRDAAVMGGLARTRPLTGDWCQAEARGVRYGAPGILV